MPVIPDFTDPSWQQSRTNIQLKISILEGKDRLMPANRGMVSDDLAKELVSYVRTFGPGAPAAPTEAATSDFDVEFTKLAKQFDDVHRQAQESASVAATESAAALSLAARSVAPGPARFFAQSCAGCHSIGGGALTGPDLKDVARRQDRDWLVRYILNPKGVLDSGDPSARQLVAESRGVVMPHPFGMTRERAEAVLDFIEAESQQPRSQFAALPIPDRTFTPEDVARGRELFLGQRALANGGAACIACHAVHGSGDLEGGRLGPNLTKVYERVGGRAALTAQLWAPGTPTMQPTYQQHALEREEVLALGAYLEETDKQGVEDASPVPLKFLLMGLGGAVLGLAVVSSLWGSSLRPRSRPPLNGRIATAQPAEDAVPPPSQGRSAVPAARQDPVTAPEDYAGLGL
jgi:mono/diheme cytochrome c family protein